MSWPYSGVQRLRRSSSAGLLGPLWNQLMAKTAGLEASVGQDRRALLQLELTVAQRVIDGRRPTGLRSQKPSREASDSTAIFERRTLANAIKQLTANGGNNNRFCTVWNHPMAAPFWKHQLAKTAIGWVE